MDYLSRGVEALSEKQLGSNSSKKLFEKELIKSLAGSYRVTFRFSETFSPKSTYDYYDRKFSAAKEIAHIIEETEDKISIQHLLYVGKDTIIKHWRQDWLYENRELLCLVKDHEWKKIEITPEQAKGTWTQKVYQVDDCPRYEGYGTWVHVDGRHFWQSTADSPLPRREITIREDYNVLRRHSHIEIFKNGDWVLDQDNEKIYRSIENNEDTLICLEKGLENFTRKDYDVQAALKWWEEQASFWNEVRSVWREIIQNHDYIKVHEDEKLYLSQFELANQFTGISYDSKKARAAIRGLLSKHIVNLTIK